MTSHSTECNLREWLTFFCEVYFSEERTGIAIGCWTAKIRRDITATAVATRPKATLKDNANKVSIRFKEFFDLYINYCIFSEYIPLPNERYFSIWIKNFRIVGFSVDIERLPAILSHKCILENKIALPSLRVLQITRCDRGLIRYKSCSTLRKI